MVDNTDNKSVLVMGVGRSGTTAIYSLLQEILNFRFRNDVDYVYEPFLWDRQTFNRPYSEVAELFNLVSSTSVESMYHHQRIPIVLNANTVVEEDSASWLKTVLTPAVGKRHYLGKLIRGNGRIALIRKIRPAMKIVFIIRNPLDVINSSSQLFTFFGSEFHKSDVERFSESVFSCFGERLDQVSSHSNSIANEYFYWYYCNLTFLRYFNEHPDNILPICYEDLVSNRGKTIENICDFLALDFSEELVQLSSMPVGQRKKGRTSLSDEEYGFLESKAPDYDFLLEMAGIGSKGIMPKLLEESVGVRKGNRSITVSHYFNGMYGAARIGILESEVARMSNELNKLLSSKRWRYVSLLLSPLDKLRTWVNSRH